MSLKTFIQSLVLRRAAYKGKTRFLPLRELRSVLLLLDSTAGDVLDAQREAEAWLAGKGIRCEVFYLDLRKVSHRNPPLTPPEKTFRTKSCLGIPALPDGRMTPLDNHHDLLLSLAACEGFALDYLVARANADFKVSAPGGAPGVGLTLSAPDARSRFTVFTEIIDNIR